MRFFRKMAVNKWSGTCHNNNKEGERDIYNIVVLCEFIEAILYDILVEAKKTISYHLCFTVLLLSTKDVR